MGEQLHFDGVGEGSLGGGAWGLEAAKYEEIHEERKRERGAED